MTKTRLPALLAGLIPTLLPSLTGAAITYTFPLAYDGVGTPIYAAAATQGWSSAHSSGGTVTTLTNTTPNGSTGGPNQTGFGSAFGAGGSGSESTYLFSISDGTNQFFQAYTTFAIQTSPTITWDMGNSSASTLVRIMVQSAGAWYITDATYATAATPLLSFQGGSHTPFSIDVSGASWNAYDTATMTIGAASTLPSTDLTGVGFHTASVANDAVTRFDNLSVIPEPATAALALLSLPLLGRRKRSARP